MARTHGDEIYFFQLLMLDPGSVYAYEGKPRDLAKLAGDLPGHDIPKATASKAVVDARKLMMKVKSIPVTPARVGNKMTMKIDMPYLNCGRNAH